MNYSNTQGEEMSKNITAQTTDQYIRSIQQKSSEISTYYDSYAQNKFELKIKLWVHNHLNEPTHPNHLHYYNYHKRHGEA